MAGTIFSGDKGNPMTLDTTKTVRELAVEVPSAIRVFQSRGIDFCCGGHKSLTEACDGLNLDAAVVLREIASADEERIARCENATDWREVPLAELIAQIVQKHHLYVRSESPRLAGLAAKVAGKHGPNHLELSDVKAAFDALAEDLRVHMLKEEEVLFPYIARMEEAVIAGELIPPPRFGQVANPVRMMMQEHDAAGDLLRKLRETTNEFTVPADGCMSFRMLYQGLLEFEADLHQHIHLENNILFPRSVALEGDRNADLVTECGAGKCCDEHQHAS